MKPEAFEARNRDLTARMARDESLRRLSHEWIVASSPYEYSYHFTWLGRPVIQLPQDILAVQEILWRVKPELVIETGIARGGSLILSASILELIGGPGRVLGIDVDIRSHNRAAIEAHPLSRRIDMLEGSSVDAAVAAEARRRASGKAPVVVLLDSNHTHEHVTRELALYSPLVTEGSYLVVFDTIVEEMPDGAYVDRPWGRGNSPSTAVARFLAETRRFEVDRDFDDKLLITMARGGYLRCVGR
jgi:cephalosporin hydroxylase